MLQTVLHPNQSSSRSLLAGSLSTMPGNSPSTGWLHLKGEPKNILRTTSEEVLSQAYKVASLTKAWETIQARCDELSLSHSLMLVDDTEDLKRAFNSLSASKETPSVLIMPWGNSWTVVLEASEGKITYLNPLKEGDKLTTENRKTFEDVWGNGVTTIYTPPEDKELYSQARRLELKAQLQRFPLNGSLEKTILTMLMWQQRQWNHPRACWNLKELDNQNIPHQCVHIDSSKALKHLISENPPGSFAIAHLATKWFFVKEESEEILLHDPFSQSPSEDLVFPEKSEIPVPVILISPKNSSGDTTPQVHSSWLNLQMIALKAARAAEQINTWNKKDAACSSESLQINTIEELAQALHSKEKVPACLLMQLESKWIAVSDLSLQHEKIFYIEPNPSGEEASLVEETRRSFERKLPQFNRILSTHAPFEGIRLS